MTALAITMDLNTCNQVYSDDWFDESRHLVFKGGAGSGKSWFCADKCIMRMVSEPGICIGAFRKVGATLKRSVFKLIKRRLSHWGFLDMCTVNKSDFTFSFQNGSEIWCLGLDDEEKLKSIEGLSAAWIEEATEFTEDELRQVNTRLRGNTGFYKQIIYSFNPISVRHIIKAMFFDDPPESCKVKSTTFNDNEFIDEEYKREMEEMGKKSPNFAAVYVRGEWGVLKGLIYGEFEFVEYPKEFNDICYGLDFGFNHPIAMVGVSFRDGDAYLTEKIYETEWTTGDLIKRMGELKISKESIIYCDAAEPDRIEELKRAGYNVLPAYKGPGSVKAGIDFLQGMNIYSKSSNVNINAEALSYSWRVDKNKKPMDEPAKVHDDAMDAMRYAIYTHIGKPTAELFTFDRSLLGI